MKTISPFPTLNVLLALGAHHATMKQMWKLRKKVRTDSWALATDVTVFNFNNYAYLCTAEKFLILLCSLFISFKMIFLCLEICIKKKHLSSLTALETRRHAFHVLTHALESTLVASIVNKKINDCI